MRHTNRVIYAETGLIHDQEVFLATVSHGKAPSPKLNPGAAQLWQIHERRRPLERGRGIDPDGHDGHAVCPDGRWLAISRTTPEVWVLDRETGHSICGPLSVNRYPADRITAASGDGIDGFSDQLWHRPIHA